MRPAWFLLLTLWASDVTLDAHALSIVPHGPHHSLRKRDASPPSHKVKVYDLHVESRIEHRFATTSISSRIANAANVSQEVFFNVVIPETAFISGFKMEVDDKVYEAYMRDKDAAKREYTEAVARGQTAGYVAASARDSNRFTVSVNVEPTKKVTFNLTYDELLTRRMGTYNLAINLDPGKVVRSMTVDVYIKEHRNITVLRVPELRTGNEVDADESTAGNSLATIVRTSLTEAHVSFSPTTEQQKSLGHIGAKTAAADQPLKGQFVVQYDVDRDTDVGDVLINEGYFVHFFAPKNLTPLRKHAIFVLDVSGSMHYRKLDQLKEAMSTILDNLSEGDYFNIIEFSDNVAVWDLNTASEGGSHRWTGSCGSSMSCDTAKAVDFPPAFPAAATYIATAKQGIKHMETIGGTNIHDALNVALKVAHRPLNNNSAGLPLDEATCAPLVIFLTDGQSSHASSEKILAMVKTRNRDPAVAIFSLAFGDDADIGFLKKLSLQNLGFARKIYQASDAALQLRDFYRQIASPLLANVTFTYQPDMVVHDAVTKTRFPTLFMGSEMVVAGKLRDEIPPAVDHSSLEVNVFGLSHEGEMARRSFVPCRNVTAFNHTVTPVEKLWAYLTIKQMLEAQESNDVTAVDTSALKQRALELALKYSFVTPLTSLVVVKPNASELVDEEQEHHSRKASSFRSFSRGPGYHHGMLPMSPVVQQKHHPAGSLISSGRRYDSQPISWDSDEYDDSAMPTLRIQPAVTTTPAALEVASTELPTPVPEAPALVRPDELVWLDALTNGQEVALPFATAGGNLTYSLLSGPGTYHVHENCTSVTGVEGFCHHLKDCPLNVIKLDVQSYKDYFCTLESYAGVCCPANLAKPLTTATP